MSFTSSRNTPAANTGSVTHPALHIRDANDAHVILEAVRLNILPLIQRRLATAERDQLSTGNVFVWEEAEDDGGLLRWTDGRRWSQSRMRGDYLFYEEKVETTQEEKDAKAARRACRASDPSAVIPTPTRRKDRPSKPNGLTKQTYSAIVHLPGSRSPRKWHVVAYFSGNDYTRLPVIESYDYLRNIRVPPGVFVSSKAGARLDRFSDQSEDNEAYNHNHQNINSAYLLPRHASSHYDCHVSVNRPISSSSSSSSSTPLTPPRYPLTLSPPLLNDGRQKVSLPPISTLGHADRRPHLPYRRTAPSICSDRSPTANYTPLSPEDRRVLDSFRITL